MGLGFGGEVADFYARFRRGYPGAVLDAVAAAFGLTADDVAVDLGCGTGQLTLPLARRVRAVVGMDPEPDMLAQSLVDAGFTDVQETIVEYRDELDLDRVIGNLYSAMPAARLPAAADRPAFADSVQRALAPDRRFTDQVRVTTLLGRLG